MVVIAFPLLLWGGKVVGTTAIPTIGGRGRCLLWLMEADTGKGDTNVYFFLFSSHPSPSTVGRVFITKTLCER